MYDEREHLYTTEYGIEEAIRSLRNAEDELSVIEFVGKETILDEITDAVNDLIDELTTIRDRIHAIDSAEIEAEKRDYYRSVI